MIPMAMLASADGGPGPELVANGDFASAAGWQFGVNWSIAGGVATLALGGGSSGRDLYQVVIPSGVISGTYQLRFTVKNYSNGVLNYQLLTAAGSSYAVSGSRSSNGTTDVTLAVSGSLGLRVQFNGATTAAASVDDVSLKKIS